MTNVRLLVLSLLTTSERLATAWIRPTTSTTATTWVLTRCSNSFMAAIWRNQPVSDWSRKSFEREMSTILSMFRIWGRGRQFVQVWPEGVLPDPGVCLDGGRRFHLHPHPMSGPDSLVQTSHLLPRLQAGQVRMYCIHKRDTRQSKTARSLLAVTKLSIASKDFFQMKL